MPSGPKKRRAAQKRQSSKTISQEEICNEVGEDTVGSNNTVLAAGNGVLLNEAKENTVGLKGLLPSNLVELGKSNNDVADVEDVLVAGDGQGMLVDSNDNQNDSVASELPTAAVTLNHVSNDIDDINLLKLLALVDFGRPLCLDDLKNVQNITTEVQTDDTAADMPTLNKDVTNFTDLDLHVFDQSVDHAKSSDEGTCVCSVCQVVFTLSQIKCTGEEKDGSSLSRIKKRVKEMLEEELMAMEKLRMVLNKALDQLSHA